LRLVDSSPDSRAAASTRPAWIALAASAAVHALVIGVLAALVTIGEGGRTNPFPTPPIVATLTSPALRFATPPVEPAARPETSIAATTDAGAAPSLPVPLKPKATLPPPATLEGNAVAQTLDARSVTDSVLESMLRSMHPDAVHALPEFIVAPAPVYPVKALPDRLQADQVVIVIVREDGRVAPLDGTLGDSFFDASIRAALAAARAQPARIDGQPRTSWSLMRFAYEFVGAR
jgi:hypothetical protein